MSMINVSIHDVLKMQESGDVKGAEAILLNIINSYPDALDPIFSLGTNFAMQGADGLATILFRFCVAMKDDDPNIYNNLGTAWRKLYRNDRAYPALYKSWELEPRADVASNLCTLFVNEGDPAPGEAWARVGIEIDPIHKHANWNIGLCLLELEQWEEGFRQYGWGIATGDRQNKVYGAKPYIPWWDGSDLYGKTIIIYGEQGIGDEIMYASMVPELIRQAGKVIIDCHPRLESLFKRSFPEADIYPTRKILTGKEDWVSNYNHIHFKRAMADLPMYLRKKDEDFPRELYLHVDDGLKDEYKSWLQLIDPQIKPVLLAWHGGKRQTRKELRTIQMKELIPLLQAGTELGYTFIDANYVDQKWEVEEAKKEGVRIFSFPEIFNAGMFEYYRVGGKEYKDKYEAKGIAKSQGVGMHHHTGCGYDYMDAAAFATAVEELGGTTITVNQSLVHLCGALGITCQVMTPFRPAWRYGLTKPGMAWYGPWVRQYRQPPQTDNWGPVIEALIGELFEYKDKPFWSRVS